MVPQKPGTPPEVFVAGAKICNVGTPLKEVIVCVTRSVGRVSVVVRHGSTTVIAN